MAIDRIIIKGAREHNLKNISLEIPRDCLVVITGISGSGKSTLAFDTIYAEGQRRYVESLSSYARQFLEKIEKPDIDSIEGLSPSISIDQRTTTRNPRSTVGTVTETYDYLRLLFARLGRPYCYKCGKEISSQTTEQMIDRVMELPTHSRITVFSPIVRGRKGEYKKELFKLRKEGFLRVRVDGEMRSLDEDISLDKNKHHYIDVVVDRLVVTPSMHRRLTDSIEIATRLSQGFVLIEYGGGENRNRGEILFNEHLSCIDCGISYPEITPRLFSFNSPYGACPSCKGVGLTVPFPSYNLQVSRNDIWPFNEGKPLPCDICGGKRLRKEALHIKVMDRSIDELTSMSVGALIDFMSGVRFLKIEEEVGYRILREVIERLRFLRDVGLDYLALNRPSSTLSGGESNRIRLASQIGSGLSGILYVLDEPTIGLHPRDNIRLIHAVKRLKVMGNTVIVVEHDEEMIRSADYIVDMGPGAGEEGGEVVASGSLFDIVRNKKSLTGRYLEGELKIPVPESRRRPCDRYIVLKGVRTNNLKDITVRFPLGLFICVTGVSGSGKSSLIIDTLYKAVSSHLCRTIYKSGDYMGLEGLEYIDRIIDVDQSPIGRTPRSNPATYSGVFNHIRSLFSQLRESRMRGYRPGRFSFNVRGGRCERCRGGGVIKIEMHFLPDVYVPCEQCRGKRYNRETLDILYKGRNISDVLDMTVSEALYFFKDIPPLKNILKVLDDVGLGYIKLGQPATTLSGGEAQRLKLSRELSKRGTGKTLYILDEPTTGLHFHDINRLLAILHALVDAGNTVIVIEHNLDVIKSADYIIDLGPEGGEHGGWIVGCGSPEEILKIKNSYTANFLREKLKEKASKHGLADYKRYGLNSLGNNP